MVVAILRKLKEEFFNVRTLELIKVTSYFIEKLFWLVVLLSGTTWFIYYASVQIITQNKQNRIVTRGEGKLSELDYPSVTFCSRAANKYGIAERIGNHLDSKIHQDNDFLSWTREIALNCSLEMNVLDTRNYYSQSLYEAYCDYQSFSCEVRRIIDNRMHTF